MTISSSFLLDKLKLSSTLNHRLFLLIPSHTQLVKILNLHAQVIIGMQPSILWLYKKIDQKIRSQYQNDVCFYSYDDTDKILGNTFGTLVLQDYEFITPNILARSIETIQGGGIIVLITEDIREKDMDLVMGKTGKKRFNNRVFRTIIKNDDMLIFDEDFNLIKKKINAAASILPQTKIKTIIECKKSRMSEDDIRKMVENENINQIYQMTKTNDQYSALTKLAEILDERSCKTVCSIIAGRGRGKSAAMGLGISLAIFKSFSTIYIAAPNIENIGTIFEFIIKGINLLGYKERINYTVFRKNINRKRYVYKLIFTKAHRQTIEYVSPYDDMNTFPDLLVIDEAASIPVPHIKKMLGSNLIFMASTISGYEGTGRSISVKLFNELRNKSKNENLFLFKEIELTDPIRYAKNDPIETWLNDLLFLNAVPSSIGSCPSPDDCNLFSINKDVLFQCHKASELFLKNLVALFVVSHYKNSPNDLMLMADVDTHSIFTLLSPIDEKSHELPNILCAIQVAYEKIDDKINREGNLIPWTLYDNYADSHFLNTKGVRIVRIAVHPDYTNMGYGTRAVKLLCDFYLNKLESNYTCDNSLIIPLNKAHKLAIDYIGTSFGSTVSLVNFWKRNDFISVHLRQTQSTVTGENSLIMLHKKSDYAQELHSCYQLRFLKLLSSSFNTIEPALCLTLFYDNGMKPENKKYVTIFTEMEKRRLDYFSRGLTEIGGISDLIHQIAFMFFTGNTELDLQVLEQCILLNAGLQFRSVKEIAENLKIDKHRVVSVLTNTVKRIYYEKKNIIMGN